MRMTHAGIAGAGMVARPGGLGEVMLWKRGPRDGLVPRSFAYRMSALYLALFVIRPWELMYPWLATISFERIFAVCTLAALLAGGHLWFQLTAQTSTVLATFAAVVISAQLGY